MVVRYRDLDKILKNDTNYADYANMPTAQSAQQTLRLLIVIGIDFKSM